MDFIRDFGGLFGLGIAAHMAGQASAQILGRKAVSSFFMLLVCSVAGLATVYYVSVDHNQTMVALTAALFVLSFFFGWSTRKHQAT